MVDWHAGGLSHRNGMLAPNAWAVKAQRKDSFSQDLPYHSVCMQKWHDGIKWMLKISI